MANPGGSGYHLGRSMGVLRLVRKVIIALGILALLIVPACARRSLTEPGDQSGSAGSGLAPPLPTVQSTGSARPIIPDGERAQVSHVYDGDTIEVLIGGKTYRLRYIGVDAPELDEPFYEEALAFNKGLIEDQTIILVRDVSDTDRYGRLLRYVYLTDGTFVNAELMRNGMTRLVTFPPDVAKTGYLRQLQTQAQESSAGMWSRPEMVGPCDCDRNLYDCRDFASQSEAQTCFQYCARTTGRDIHHLDGGGDGQVCEFLP